MAGKMRKPAAASAPSVKRPAAAKKGRPPAMRLIDHQGRTYPEFVAQVKEEYKDYKAREESFKTRCARTGRFDSFRLNVGQVVS